MAFFQRLMIRSIGIYVGQSTGSQLEELVTVAVISSSLHLMNILTRRFHSTTKHAVLHATHGLLAMEPNGQPMTSVRRDSQGTQTGLCYRMSCNSACSALVIYLRSIFTTSILLTTTMSRSVPLVVYPPNHSLKYPTND